VKQTSLEEMRRDLARDNPIFGNCKISDSDLRVMWKNWKSFLGEREALLAAGKFEDYLLAFDGHKRFAAFREIHERMPDADYWKCVALAWENIEVSLPDAKTWLAFFESKRPLRESLMTQGERKALAGLPDTLTVFRGYAMHGGHGGRDGLSWTLSEAVARRFAEYATGGRRAALCGHKRDATRMIISGQCRKRDVLAYFNGRKEREIVVRPENVFAKHSRELKGKPTE
jgi:hypothetical protein